MKLSLTTILFLISQLLFSQAKISTEGLQLVKSRPLIVELLEEDPALLKKFETKVKKAKKEELKAAAQAKLDSYKEFIADFNSGIQKAVANFWELNSTVEYKTTSEVLILKEKKNKDYALLRISELTEDGRSKFKFKIAKGTGALFLGYGRIEEGRSSPDYLFMMPERLSGNPTDLNYVDLALTLQLMTAHLNEVIKQDSNTLTFNLYGRKKGREHCESVKTADIYMPAHLVHKKTTIEEMNSTHVNGNVTEIAFSDMESAILNKEDKVIAISLPFKFRLSRSSSSNIEFRYLRCLFNSATGEVFYCKGGDPGEYTDKFFRSNEFVNIAKKCN